MGIHWNIILLKIIGFSSNMSRSLGPGPGPECLDMVYLGIFEYRDGKCRVLK